MLLILPYEVALTFDPLDEILKFVVYWKGSDRPELSYGAVCGAPSGGSNCLVCG